MRIYTILLGFILTISLANGQKIDYSVDLVMELENSNYSLTKDNLVAKYVSYDFSTLINPKHDFLGYIGNDYQRIKIYFSSITKDKGNNKRYLIKGKSIVENNECDFDGTITITQICEYKQIHFGVDDVYKDSAIRSQGMMIGSFDLKENPEQKHSGVFHGNMTLSWYVDKNGKMRYDDIQSYSDSYRNNQYAGIWKSYTSETTKTCNWGEYRIPFSNDLDIWAGEFSPNPKYEKKGWSDLIIK